MQVHALYAVNPQEVGYSGLTYDNVVPCCASCEEHHINGFEAAQERVRLYLDQDRQPKFIPQDEDKYKDEVMSHIEYH